MADDDVQIEGVVDAQLGIVAHHDHQDLQRLLVELQAVRCRGLVEDVDDAVLEQLLAACLLPKDKLTAIEDAPARAQRAELDQVYILDLKDKYAAALEASLQGPDTRSAVSDQTFLLSVLGPPSQPTAHVTSSTSAIDDKQEVD